MFQKRPNHIVFCIAEVDLMGWDSGVSVDFEGWVVVRKFESYGDALVFRLCVA